MRPEITMDNQENNPDLTIYPLQADVDGLTGIPKSIHCPATQEECEAGYELDEIAIDQFLDTLAGIALSIATRELSDRQDQEWNN